MLAAAILAMTPESIHRLPQWGAELILAGELWRAVTALTLHADHAHLLSNAIACALFLSVVCGALGAGVGSALVLLAGAGGNLANALLHGSHRVSVGAATGGLLLIDKYLIDLASIVKVIENNIRGML